VHLVCQEQNNEEVYHGSPADHNALLQFANEKCVPLVRELTFENAEVLVYDVLLIVLLIILEAVCPYTALMQSL